MIASHHTLRPRLLRAQKKVADNSTTLYKSYRVRRYLFLRTMRTVVWVDCLTKTWGPLAYLRHNSSV